ncbi:hypothetical protein [Geodermatophilus amargosae]|uniref:hypothetical protein n=1 Tax=Geodermatophilus amargosae TaxID=1296565 RepID=UPI0034DF1079
MTTLPDDGARGATTGATPDAPAAGPTPPDGNDLADFLASLEKRQSELGSSIKQGKATLADEESQHQKLKKQLGDVTRTATDLGKGRTEGRALLAEVDRALATAAPLIERLDDDTRAEIARRLAEIDQDISDAADVVEAESGKLDQLQKECDRLHGEAAARQAAYDQALSWLTGLPAAIKQQMGTIKGLRAGLDAACTAGQALKACVLAAEVTTHRGRLEEMVAPDQETQLITYVRSAAKDLADARAALATGQAALDDQRELLARRSTELENAQDARAGAVEELHTPSAPAAPAA